MRIDAAQRIRDSVWPVSPRWDGARAMTTLLTFTQLAAKDLLGVRPSTAGPEAHALAAEAWLQRAHDCSADDGVSYGYSLRGGWRPSYRETSGYIAATFFALARHRGDPAYRERALRVCRWLLEVQNADGSFSNPRFGDEGIVFDTGQDLFGLVRAWEETGDAAFREGALRAAGWLVGIADEAGLWTRNEHLDTPHVYNTRTAWALLRASQIEYDAASERVARANLDWALEEQQPSGFFAHCAFERGANPFTHTLAYTARGAARARLRDATPGHPQPQSRRARRDQGLAADLGPPCAAHLSELGDQVLRRRDDAMQPVAIKRPASAATALVGARPMHQPRSPQTGAMPPRRNT